MKKSARFYSSWYRARRRIARERAIKAWSRILYDATNVPSYVHRLIGAVGSSSPIWKIAANKRCRGRSAMPTTFKPPEGISGRRADFIIVDEVFSDERAFDDALSQREDRADTGVDVEPGDMS